MSHPASPSLTVAFRYFTLSGLRKALDRLCQEAEAAVKAGQYAMICLSDRGYGPNRAPVPSLLATGAVHHHLVQLRLRSNVGLLVDSGEPREVGGVTGMAELLADIKALGTACGAALAVVQIVWCKPHLSLPGWFACPSTGAPVLPAGGLRRGRRVPLPGLRRAGGHAARRQAACLHAPGGAQVQVCQGPGRGHPEGTFACLCSWGTGDTG